MCGQEAILPVLPGRHGYTIPKSITYLSIMRIQSIIIILFFLLAACSTKTYITDPQKLKGKRIAVAEIVLGTAHQKDKVHADTLCDCLATTVAETLYPYLQQVGMTVVQLPVWGKTREEGAYRMADSLQLDYLVLGTGLIQFEGKTPFMWNLSLKIVDAKTREVRASGSFSGPGVTPAGAGKRIGKKLVGQMKNK